MPLLSPWSALFLSSALLWLPATRAWALAPLAIAWAWAWTDGLIDPVALAAPALLLLAAAAVRPTSGAAARASGHALFLVLAAALFLHLL
ncbi:MAG TPA: CPBP family intramembrane metalloprotease domain-containing protein, partial [Achromobacter sp.]|nr:CPBP family intramembrane metalloprotease domain-containing protein [Achromobacter sp.]